MGKIMANIMTDGLYEITKEKIQNLKKYSNLHNAEYFCKDQKDCLTCDKYRNYPYYTEISEYEPEKDSTSTSREYHVKFENIVHYNGSVYNNTIVTGIYWQIMDYFDYYAIRTRYSFDKKFVQEQLPICMTLVENQFNKIFSGIGHYITIYPKMEYDYKDKTLSVYSELKLHVVPKIVDTEFDLKVHILDGIDEFLAIGTLRSIYSGDSHFERCYKDKHLSTEIYKCIDYLKETYEESIYSNYNCLSGIDASTEDEVYEQYEKAIGTLYEDFLKSALKEVINLLVDYKENGERHYDPD